MNLKIAKQFLKIAIFKVFEKIKNRVFKVLFLRVLGAHLNKINNGGQLPVTNALGSLFIIYQQQP
jgi:hypothetical protein